MCACPCRRRSTKDRPQPDANGPKRPQPSSAMMATKEHIGVLRILAGITPFVGPQVQSVIDVALVIISKIEVRNQANGNETL